MESPGLTPVSDSPGIGSGRTQIHLQGEDEAEQTDRGKRENTDAMDLFGIAAVPLHGNLT